MKILTQTYFHQPYHTFYIWDPKFRKKFFASVDQEILLQIFKKKVCDADILWLLERIIESYQTTPSPTCGLEPPLLRKEGTARGIPIGNLTSQIFANIYLNELDYFAKFSLKEKYYFRYQSSSKSKNMVSLALTKARFFAIIALLL